MSAFTWTPPAPGSAIIDGDYRYQLARWWTPAQMTSRVATWVMLNPSTADGMKDDPTIRKVIGFSKRLGFDAALVVNLFAFRATDPNAVYERIKGERFRGIPAQVIGPRNDEYILDAVGRAESIIVGWGAADYLYCVDRIDDVVRLLTSTGKKLMCLGRTKTYLFPRHPLMVGYKIPLEEWRP